MILNKIYRKIRISPADTATSMNLVCGLLSMIMAAHDHYLQAIWLIVMAMVFDSVDGNLAKMFNSASEFGRELDSLADMVSFGAAPAFLFSALLIQPEFSFFPFLVPAGYAVCVAVRLARFNVRPPVKGYFQGLPSPSAALGAVMLMLVAIDRKWVELPFFGAAAMTWMAALAFLMVSKTPYPKPFGSEYKRWKPFFSLMTAVSVLAGMVFNAPVAFMTAMMVYITASPFQVFYLSRKEQVAIH